MSCIIYGNLTNPTNLTYESQFAEIESNIDYKILREMIYVLILFFNTVGFLSIIANVLITILILQNRNNRNIQWIIKILILNLMCYPVYYQIVYILHYVSALWSLTVPC